MEGKWVYTVSMKFNYKIGLWNLFKLFLLRKIIAQDGYNSCFESLPMAKLKASRMKREMNRIGSGHVLIQKIMYFKGEAEEGSFDDRCSVCGDQLERNVDLTKTHSSSTEKA